MASYVIEGIDPAPFKHLVGLTDDELAAQGVVRTVADRTPGFPCRVSLEDADIGEAVLLLNHEHLPVGTPYRSCHAIFVREGATVAARFVDRIPEQLSSRLLSVRAFDARGMMTDADVVDGSELDPLITRMLAEESNAYLHVHNAKRGCFAAEVRRI